MDDWVTLASIVRPQGRKGEVLADLLTDFPEQFAARPEVSLLKPDGTRSSTTVEEHWMPTGRSAGRVVLKIAGIDDITSAETLAKCKVQIAQNDRLALDDATYYVNDLVGCVLTDGAVDVGIVRELHFPCDSEGRRLHDAAPLFVVERADGDEVMIPFANEFVERISVTEKRIEMKLPNGLLEMNG